MLILGVNPTPSSWQPPICFLSSRWFLKRITHFTSRIIVHKYCLFFLSVSSMALWIFTHVGFPWPPQSRPPTNSISPKGLLTPRSPPPQFLLPRYCFVSLGMSYKWSHTVGQLWRMASLASHHVFEVHLSCCLYLQFGPLDKWGVPPWLDGPHFHHPFVIQFLGSGGHLPRASGYGVSSPTCPSPLSAARMPSPSASPQPLHPLPTTFSPHCAKCTIHLLGVVRWRWGGRGLPAAPVSAAQCPITDTVAAVSGRLFRLSFWLWAALIWGWGGKSPHLFVSPALQTRQPGLTPQLGRVTLLFSVSRVTLPYQLRHFNCELKRAHQALLACPQVRPQRLGPQSLLFYLCQHFPHHLWAGSNLSHHLKHKHKQNPAT